MQHLSISRIDFGKYGAWYFHKSIEDNDYYILLSLFGIHSSSDGFSTTNQIMSIITDVIFCYNLSFLSDAITLVGIYSSICLNLH